MRAKRLWTTYRLKSKTSRGTQAIDHPAFPWTGRDNSESCPTLTTGPFASFAYGLTRFACPNEIKILITNAL